MACKGLTATMIFESAALNRDEKIGGNVLSIKKMARDTGVFSYFSKTSIRHHLFQTLYYRSGWEPAPVAATGDGNNKVIQFSFPEANILTYAELDLFGYMNTDFPGNSTRKAPLGITKAVAVEPWQADMAFGANHDLVWRLRQQGEKAEPNPYSKEEHYSFYRLSFTLDLCRFGYDECLWDLNKVSGQVPSVLKEWLDAYTEESNRGEVEKGASWASDKITKLGDEAKWYRYHAGGEELGYVAVLTAGKEIGKAAFIVADGEREERLKDLLSVLKNGLMFHSSGENYGINPVFLIIGCLEIPVPVFNSCVRLSCGKIEAQPIQQVLTSNDYIFKAYLQNSLPLFGEINAPKLVNRIDVDAIVGDCLKKEEGKES